MRYVHKLFSGRHAGRPAAVLTVALGLAFACSESPTGSDSGTLEQALFKGKPDKGKPPPAPTVEAVLPVAVVEPPSPPGVYGDGMAYTAGIAQACPDRKVFLVKPDGMPAGLPLPAVCNESGRVQVHLPGDPLAEDQDPYGDAEPSFTIRGGKVHPTGWMRPTLNLFWDCSGSASSFCNFVWTDGDVTARTVTGTCAKLYVDYTGVPMPPSVEAPTCEARDKDGQIVKDENGNDVGFPLELLVHLTVQ